MRKSPANARLLSKHRYHLQVIVSPDMLDKKGWKTVKHMEFGEYETYGGLIIRPERETTPRALFNEIARY